jgi:hypothetical protein
MGTSAAVAAAAAAAEAAAEASSRASSDPAGAGRVAGQQAAGLAAAAAVLEGLLADAWADGEVAAAFEQLEPAPVPVFAQQRRRQQQQQDGDVGDLPQVQVLPEEAVYAGHQQAVGDAGGEGVAKPAEEAAVGVQQQPDFQAFADFVLDSAVVGILQDGLLEQELHAA